MPAWVLLELNTRVFSFFWAGKRDLVARKVVFHPKELGGYGMVSVAFKVRALLVQWVRCFLKAPSGWVYIMTYWFLDRFGASPLDVFSSPDLYPRGLLPPFYASLLRAWLALGGLSSSGGLTVGSRGGSGQVAR